MSENYKDIKKRTCKAIGAIPDYRKPNLSAITREFNVPYSRLYARVKGR